MALLCKISIIMATIAVAAAHSVSHTFFNDFISNTAVRLAHLEQWMLNMKSENHSLNARIAESEGKLSQCIAKVMEGENRLNQSINRLKDETVEQQKWLFKEIQRIKSSHTKGMLTLLSHICFNI